MTTETREAMAARHARDVADHAITSALAVADVLALYNDDRAARALDLVTAQNAALWAMLESHADEYRRTFGSAAFLRPEGVERVVGRVRP